MMYMYTHFMCVYTNTILSYFNQREAKDGSTTCSRPAVLQNNSRQEMV